MGHRHSAGQFPSGVKVRWRQSLVMQENALIPPEETGDYMHIPAKEEGQDGNVTSVLCM